MSKRWLWIGVMVGLGGIAYSSGCDRRPEAPEGETEEAIPPGPSNTEFIPGEPITPEGAQPPDKPTSPGPWPVDAFKNYSTAYAIPDLTSMSVDDGFNIWLLRDRQVGVLRPGDTKPTWTSEVGHAGTNNITGKAHIPYVICGGSAGRAYVGYLARELGSEPIALDDPRRFEGDADVLKLNGDGTVALEMHLEISNSNNHRYDETRSILACAKVMREQYKGDPRRGDIYFGNNHGVTRVRGLEYNDHRHPVWAKPKDYYAPGCYDASGRYVYALDSCEKGMGNGYHYGLSITQDGMVFMSNIWKFALVNPKPELATFDRFEHTPWLWDAAMNDPTLWTPPAKSAEPLPGDGVDGGAPAPAEPAEEAKIQPPPDEWRATAHTVKVKFKRLMGSSYKDFEEGLYFLGSEHLGLWNAMHTPREYVKVQLPSDKITALAATDDKSLFVGTFDQGLWQLDVEAWKNSAALNLPQASSMKRLTQVQGTRVKQLLYDPTVVPAMLYVLTDAGLYVLRGH